MAPAFDNVPIPMHHLVVVRAEPPGQHTAWVVSFPEIRAVAATEQEALEQVQRHLEEWLATARFVHVQAPMPPVANPMLPHAGRIDPNDPLEQEYLAELARMRREDLEQTLREYGEECSRSSSTPIT